MEPCCQICGELLSACTEIVSTTHTRQFDSGPSSTPGNAYCAPCFSEMIKMAKVPSIEDIARRQLLEMDELDTGDMIGDWVFIAAVENIQNDHLQYAVLGASMPVMPHVLFGLAEAARSMAVYGGGCDHCD